MLKQTKIWFYYIQTILVVVCGALSIDLTKETVLYTNAQKYQSVAMVKCRPGYTKDIVSYNTTCSAGGQWNRNSAGSCNGE